jgi:hypothetical protein
MLSICADKLLCVCASGQFYCICIFKIYNITEELTILSTSHLHNILLKISVSLIQILQNFIKKW